MHQRYPTAALVLLGALGGCSQTSNRTPNVSSSVPVSSAKSELTPSSPGIPSESKCPGEDFPSFLKAFAANNAVQAMYTLPEVMVTDWRDPNETEEGTQIAAIARNEYHGFTIEYQDGAFRDIAADGTVDPEPVKVDVHKQGENYEVSYVYNLAEGNSWLFKPKGDCWFLAEDPEPSDP